MDAQTRKTLGAAPRFDLSPAAGWVLKRAFSTADGGLLAPASRSAALTFADIHGLTGRVAARTPHELLDAELGMEVSSRFRYRYLQAARAALAVEATVREVAAAAASEDVPLLLLKGAALHLLRLTPPGARPLSDLDLLVPPEGAERLFSALCARGWSPAVSSHSNYYHMEPLVRPGGGVLEIHFKLPCLALDGSKLVEAGDLLASGFVERLPGLPGFVAAPSHLVFCAHVLSHAFVSHWNGATGFPLVRALADLLDLGLSRQADEVRRIGLGWTDPWLPRLRAEAAIELAGVLESGNVPDRGDHREAAALLDYLLASKQDRQFATVLAGRSGFRRFWRDSSNGGLAQAVLRRLPPSQSTSDELHGRQDMSGLRLWAKLKRLFTLLKKATRYLLAEARIVLR